MTGATAAPARPAISRRDPARAERRRTRASLAEFCRPYATDEYTLVVHSVDLDHRRYFPNSFVVSKRREDPANLHTDASFSDLELIGAESFDTVVCTGLLEHVREPARLLGEFHRILRPGGRLVLSASAVFPFHSAPDNYFHFTTHGVRYLLRDWSRIEALEGSTRPFATIAVLLQRIYMQCDLVPPARPLLMLASRVVPLLDVLVRRQYDSAARSPARVAESFMPATLHAVAVK